MLAFNNVSKEFKGRQVLAGVSLEMSAGERVALIGSNGAGKTTLIRCLLGEYVHQGEIWLDRLSPRLHRDRVLARIGFVPQIPPPLKMPVGELVAFAAETSRAEASRIEDVMERLGLDPRQIASQPFVKLSGGQKQKVLISVALGRDCDVLVMDEPAANLDPPARHIFFQLLAERQNDAAMLITSHRLDEVAALVNRVIELDQGRIVLDDRVEDAVDLAGRLDCRICLTRNDEAFAKAIREWKFETDDGGRSWQGGVAGPDRLRFLGMVSRYAGLLSGLEIREPGGGRP
jgi:ABC-2 type transport system ATP-binding protein